MPKTIKNMLRDGIPSKIYWYAYPKPIKGYGIAREIYKVFYGRPEPRKIYPYINVMVNEGKLTKVNREVQSNPQSLLKEIEICLKDKHESLNENEKLRTLRILENDFFRGIIQSAIETEGDKQRDSIDAFLEISYILAVSVILPTFPLWISEKSTRKETEENGGKFIGFIDSKVKEPQSQNPIDQFLYYLHPNLAKKLLRLLPVDLMGTWATIERAMKRLPSG
jgi:hypothetical protein